VKIAVTGATGFIGQHVVAEMAAVAARLAAVDSAQVERWLERILTANSPDELFGCRGAGPFTCKVQPLTLYQQEKAR
jgi:nucleoside-diphosphate-sugar epimerase